MDAMAYTVDLMVNIVGLKVNPVNCKMNTVDSMESIVGLKRSTAELIADLVMNINHLLVSTEG